MLSNIGVRSSCVKFFIAVLASDVAALSVAIKLSTKPS